MKVVYVAGRYRAKTLFGIFLNIVKAWLLAQRVWRAGFAAVCPHTNTFWMSEPPINIPPDAFLQGDLAILDGCDAILMVPGWEQSAGARGEREYAFSHNIPVYYSVEDLRWEELGLRKPLP